MPTRPPADSRQANRDAVRTRGTTATLLVVLLLALWTVVAGVNWGWHARRRVRT